MRMNNRLPLGYILVAVLQFIALMILPLSTLQSIGPFVWIVVLVIFALLGFSLLRRQAWSRLATIFVQGFNIIIRVLVGISHVFQGAKAGGSIDVWLIGTFLLSIALSALILYYVDLPDVQILVQ
jgi:hypothetical protein